MITLDRISFSYPYSNTRTLKNISLSVSAGELLLCTGASGCGKSTLIRVMNGLIPGYTNGDLSGSISLDGRPTTGRSPACLASEIGTLFQDPERQFFALTVADEIAMSLQWRGWPVEKTEQAVLRAAQRMQITDILGNSIFGLSEGQKQKVAIAALLACEPKVLLFDEPSANLDPESAAELARTLVELKQQGLAIFIADHRLSWLKNIADKVAVMNEGEIVASGTYALLNDEGLRSRNGLRVAHDSDPRPSLPPVRDILAQREEAFRCSNLSFHYKRGKKVFTGADFVFCKGEVIALLGPNGSGKTTLARICTGLEKTESGDISVQGKSIPAKHLPAHVQVVLQNASHQLRMQTVSNELYDAAGFDRGLPAHDGLILDTLEQYGLSHLSDRHPQSLSGGEKQRLAIACATIRSPGVIFFDEPTSGLDGKNMQRVAERISNAAKNGACAIVITHDLELMAAVCTCKLDLGELHLP